ncbi:adhesion G-protein coupled receptor G5-like [Scomber japonicus]|uniref:adhesion G-protein coupled receptor G5-like n=1 Tax=Scomber japonicus TaxID=13676 RepID=UPI002306B29C|nr:adhesion G-protein coupled receptor G5-like [Scomber japonicus]
MWKTLCLVLSVVWVSMGNAGGRPNPPKIGTPRPLSSTAVNESNPATTQSARVSRSFCENVFNECRHMNDSWTRCYDDKIRVCRRGRQLLPNFIWKNVNLSEEADEGPTSEHRVHIPSSVLQRCSEGADQGEVQLVITVLDSSYFKLTPPPPPGRGRTIRFGPVHMKGEIMGGTVLVVKAGSRPVSNLSQPIILTFKHNKMKNGTCVFWQESDEVDGTGHWSTDGILTSVNGTHFKCSCDHLSFFAVLVNPEISVDKINAENLSYITYVGSALSVFFTAISLIIYICLQRRRPEKAISVHMQLTGALLCLHLSFLLCSFWANLLEVTEEDWVCKALGFFLHWSLLSTISWMALEGFHLYLLLVRVFNIYVRRYVLKLSLVGWGVPTLIAVACWISGVYGKYILRAADDFNSTMPMCGMSSKFPQRLLVSYLTTMAFPCVVILYNTCMLGLVVFKLWRLRAGDSVWNKMNREKGSRLWKDCATVLGLSFVLGLPWGLASTTYISLPGLYIFTILNSLQGVFVFLWSMALTCKSRSDYNSSVKDFSSSQKMMTTSFNS